VHTQAYGRRGGCCNVRTFDDAGIKDVKIWDKISFIKGACGKEDCLLFQTIKLLIAFEINAARV
jgi:hypothetical protein